MKYLYFGRRALFSLSLLSALITASAGNIPQYGFRYGGSAYAEFSDGILLDNMKFSGNGVLFANGTFSPNAYKGSGFPIGFDFRLGGRTVDCFAVSNHGSLYLGKGEVDYGNDAFRVGMSTVKNGLYKADVSYKTSGEVGERVLTVQYKNAYLNEAGSNKGVYSLQIRLYEADGRIEMAFKEIDTTYTGCGFDTGLSGWDADDAILLTATGLDKTPEISSFLKANLLEPGSYIAWDEDDYDQHYAPVYTFIPESDTTPPASAPDQLEVTQEGADLLISCRRASGAAATAVLFSTEPFSDTDMPVDGETFRGAYFDVNGKQVFPSALGNARPLYYGNAETITTRIQGVEQGKKYYIRAVSANGYPAWNRTDVAENVFTTSQAAPSGFDGTAVSNGVLLQWSARDRVIIAATTERQPGYGAGYAGLFGTPASDAAPGDLIEGGGEVIYSGDDGLFRANTEPNAMTYFRAWTVRDGRVSATAADYASAPLPTYPYAPAIEDYPTGSEIKGWTATGTSGSSYMPYVREAANENVVRTVSVNGARQTLATPELPLNVPLRITFDYAIETLRSAEASEDSGSVALPKGEKPGEFGNGSLDLIAGGAVVRSVNSYNGTMTPFAADEYVSGTSTFEPFAVEIPAIGGSGSLEISFAGDSENTTTLYLRNIRIEALAEAPVAPSEAPAAITVDEDRDGFLHVNCNKGSDAAYTMVLVSEVPVTADDIPADGKTLTAGAQSGNAKVVYWGEDEEIVCATTAEILVSDFDRTYYVAAVSASAVPLYNRTEITQMEYRTLPDFSAPSDLAVVYDSEAKAIDITATRHENAASTLILVSPATFDDIPEDGEDYTEGETLGNATVVYHGTDSGIAVHHVLADLPPSVTVTAYSRNPKGWYSIQSRSVDVQIINVGVESIVDDCDLSEAEIYNVAGVRLQVSELSELPAGVYIVNGKKVVIR